MTHADNESELRTEASLGPSEARGTFDTQIVPKTTPVAPHKSMNEGHISRYRIDGPQVGVASLFFFYDLQGMSNGVP